MKAEASLIQKARDIPIWRSEPRVPADREAHLILDNYVMLSTPWMKHPVDEIRLGGEDSVTTRPHDEDSDQHGRQCSKK